MPGTEPGRADLGALVRQLTVAGWLFLSGEFGFILFQMERARSVGGSRFATVLDQRVEVLSFLVLPSSIVVLVPAAAAAAVASHLPGSRHSAWLDTLLRITAGIAITLIGVGVAAVAEIATRPGDIDIDAVFLRLGGMSIAAGVAWLCRIGDAALTGDPPAG